MTIFLFLLAGCAAGATGDPDGGARRDSNIDAPLRDGARLDGASDGGPGSDVPACVDDDYSDECAEVAPLIVRMGDEPIEVEGFLPTLADADWFAIEFPAQSEMTMQGVGTPSINLAGDATMVMDIRDSCDATLPVACGEGSAREATSFSFVDDQSLPGEVDGDGTDTFTTRDVPWPSILFVRVGRRGGPATCEPYTLTFSR